ncbi:MAG TPA: hypothetical protein PKD48_02000 [Sphingopyxis sp.]|nr:hypothetical protein [Sphingopyxis sp.]
MNLAHRAAATQATWDKYRGRTFDWKGATCIHVLRFHLRSMGHKPPRLPAFQSPIGARRALANRGWGGLSDLSRGIGLMEIGTAEMIVGDVAILPGNEGFDALTICAGNKFMGFQEEAAGFQMMELDRPAIITAFRI